MQIFQKITSSLFFGFLGLLMKLGTIQNKKQNDKLRKFYANQPDVMTLELTCPGIDPQKPDRLALMEEQVYEANDAVSLMGGSSPSLKRFPILSFNGKVVARSRTQLSGNLDEHSLTIDPNERANLIIKTFPSKPTTTDWSPESGWTVYVNPSEFNRSEYDRIVSCYEAHRQEIEQALETSTVSPKWTGDSFGFDSRIQYVAHLIYYTPKVAELK